MCAKREEGGGRKGGEQVAAIRKWMGNVLSGKLRSIPHRVAALQQRSSSEDGDTKGEQVVLCGLTGSGVPRRSEEGADGGEWIIST